MNARRALLLVPVWWALEFLVSPHPHTLVFCLAVLAFLRPAWRAAWTAYLAVAAAVVLSGLIPIWAVDELIVYVEVPRLLFALAALLIPAAWTTNEHIRGIVRDVALPELRALRYVLAAAVLAHAAGTVLLLWDPILKYAGYTALMAAAVFQVFRHQPEQARRIPWGYLAYLGLILIVVYHAFYEFRWRQYDIKGVPVANLPIIPHPENRIWTAPSHHVEMSGDTIPDYTITTNEQGIRDRLFGPKAPGAFRVLCVGDSFTLGQDVSLEQTFAKQLEQILRDRYPDRETEVVNFGCIGTAPWQQLIALERYGFGFEPDLVVHQFFTGNDLHDEATRKPMMLEAYAMGTLEFAAHQIGYEPYEWEFQLGKMSRMFGRRAFTLRTFWQENARRQWRPRAGIDFERSHERPPWAEASLKEYGPRLQEAWDMVEGTFAEGRDACRERGIPYLILHIPDQFTLYPVPDRMESRQYVLDQPELYDFERSTEETRAMADRIDVPVILLRERFQPHIERGGELLYPAYTERHLTPKGNQVTATALADWIEAHALKTDDADE